MSVGTKPAAGSEDALVRIEARLERIERMLGRVEAIADQVPGAVAIAGDVVDEWAAKHGHVDERYQALIQLLERASKPEVLHAMEVFVTQIEAAPGLVAMAGDIFDELARDAETQGVDLHELATNFLEAVRGVILLASRREIRELIESEMFSAGAVRTLSNVAHSMTEARAAEPSRVGVFGVLGKMGDPDVQRAVGFALEVAKRFGESMEKPEPAAKRLPAGA